MISRKNFKPGTAIPQRERSDRLREHPRRRGTQPTAPGGLPPPSAMSAEQKIAGADPHHLRFAQRRALSCKVSDEFTVPLCRGHHRELHRYGDEAIWWSRLGIDVLQVARALWLKSHPLPTTLEVIAGDSDSVLVAVSVDQKER
jgi:hypothetical protein